MKKLIVVFVFVLLFVSSCISPKPSQDGVVAVLSVNDMHAAIDRMPRLGGVVDSLKKIYPDLLVFSAGDNRTGNPINDLYDPTNGPMIGLMNQVGFDLCAVGNHDWDGGVGALQHNIEDANFPFLCANVQVPQGVKLEVKPYEILEVQGLKIAVVGLLEVGPKGLPSSHPRYFTGFHFDKPIDVMQDYLFLRNQSNVFILLSHLGFEDDLEMAQRYPELDAIIGGHTHTLVEHPSKHNGVMVTQAGSKLQYATLVLFKVEKGKVVDVNAETIDLQHGKNYNKEMQVAVNQYSNEKCYTQPLAEVITPFKNREELGCMLTDAFRDQTGADVAFTNPGGVRVNHMNTGPITIMDVYEIDPFANEIVVYTMTGKQVERFIMESYKKNGRQPSYVSGMKYEVRTASDGYPKSVNIKLDHGRFSPDSTYTVAMNSYMASSVRFESIDDGVNTFMTSDEMVIEFLKTRKTVSYKGVSRVK